jgi:hypothetical protein
MTSNFTRDDREDLVVVSLCRHFVERWTERIGRVPSLDDVNHMLGESVKIRSQMTVFKRSGSGFEPYKLLAEYLNFRLGVIFKVDESNGHLVTVFVIPRI